MDNFKLSAKQYNQTISVESDNDTLSPDEALDLFKTMFFALGYSYEQWQTSIQNESEFINN